ncbi:hypothetical protein ACOMHN_017807 [Nucella lapillus]
MVYPEFPGKGEHEIELPGKNYEDIVEFLLHMYPVHSLRPLTERRLLALLPLAEEYQAEHIREKCHEFITRMSMQCHRQNTSTGSLLIQWFVKLDEQLMGDIIDSAVRNEDKNLEKREQEKERRRRACERKSKKSKCTVI